jgi:hypothetical protein
MKSDLPHGVIDVRDWKQSNVKKKTLLNFFQVLVQTQKFQLNSFSFSEKNKSFKLNTQ